MNLLAPIQKAQSWRLFSRNEEVTSLLEVIKWWELRRVPYNLIVGATGIFTCVVALIIAAIASEKFGEPLGLPDPPIIAVFAVFAYSIVANVCFTGGWIAGLLARKIWKERANHFAQISFSLGLLFSVLLTLAPAALLSGLLTLRLLFR